MNSVIQDTPIALMEPTWRHAVLFDGSPLRDPEHQRVAEELLTEWGAARGLSPIGYVTQERDYRIGHGMEFSGEMTEPAQGGRLGGPGRKVPEMLAGFEEHVPWPIPDGWQAERRG